MKTNPLPVPSVSANIRRLRAVVGILAGAAVLPAFAAEASPKLTSSSHSEHASEPGEASLQTDLAAMMKHMGAMMEKMSATMHADSGKREASPSADMENMSRMMKEMSGMMSAMSAASDKSGHDSSAAKDGMCSCGEKMMGGMEKKESGPTPTSSTAKTATPSDHSAHH